MAAGGLTVKGSSQQPPVDVPGPFLTQLRAPAPSRGAQQMCALAGLAAEAAAGLGALEAGAPALAAGATCPLRAADLMCPDAVYLLAPVIHGDLMQAVTRDGGLALHEARLVYRGAAVGTLASIVRRILWRDVLAWLERGGEDTGLAWVVYILQALCTVLKCPFFVRAAAERQTAIREAAVR